MGRERVVNKTKFLSLWERIQSFQLSNGIRVFYKQFPFLYSLNLAVWTPVGSSYEPNHKAGLAHFLEHLFFKGTKHRTLKEIMEAIECKGGQVNAYTSQEYTCIYLRVLPEHLPIAVEILADILKHSTFSEVDKERNVILEEISLLEDTPEDWIIDLYHQFIWGDHPLGHPILGTRDTISKITRRDIVQFYQRWYKPEHLIFTVVGNFDTRQLHKELEKWFEDFPRHNASVNTPKSPRFCAGMTQHIRDVAQVHLCVGFPSTSITGDERYVSDLVTNILGGGSTSRLFYRVREQEGLAYNITTFQDLFRDVGTIGIYAGTSVENVDKVLGIILEELRKLRTEPLREDELELYRQELKGELLLAYEQASTHVARIGRSVVYNEHIPTIRQMIQSLDKIQPKDICAFMEKYCRSDTLALVALTPEELDLTRVWDE